MRGHLRQYSVSNSVMKVKFFANKNTPEIEQTEENLGKMGLTDLHDSYGSWHL